MPCQKIHNIQLLITLPLILNYDGFDIGAN